MRTIYIICKMDSTQTDIVNIQGTDSAIYSEMFSEGTRCAQKVKVGTLRLKWNKARCTGVPNGLHVLCSKAVMTFSVLRDTIRGTLCTFDITHRLNIH